MYDSTRNFDLSVCFIRKSKLKLKVEFPGQYLKPEKCDQTRKIEKKIDF